MRQVVAGSSFGGHAVVTFPSLAGPRAAMLGAGAASVHLSGAGPAIFSLFETEESAIAVANSLRDKGFTPFVARSLISAEARPTPLI